MILCRGAHFHWIYSLSALLKMYWCSLNFRQTLNFMELKIWEIWTETPFYLSIISYSFCFVLALKIAFGSLYSYEVDAEILNNNLIPVLAASRMFQLDGLLQHCEESMLDLICADNVCHFYEAATRYDLSLVRERWD